MDQHPRLAREGWGILAAVTAAWLICLVTLPALSWLLLIVLVFCLQFFRDPHRQVVQEANTAISPADGKIVSVLTCTNPFTQQQALKISVFMNVFNVHSNRMPLSGSVVKQQYFRGEFVNAILDKASERNERNAITLQTQCGEVTVVQVAGLIARRILSYVAAGNVVQQGQRFGFIRFGSRVDVYLPPHSQALVFPGERVSAGLTRLASIRD